MAIAIEVGDCYSLGDLGFVRVIGCDQGFRVPELCAVGAIGIE